MSAPKVRERERRKPQRERNPKPDADHEERCPGQDLAPGRLSCSRAHCGRARFRRQVGFRGFRYPSRSESPLRVRFGRLRGSGGARLPLLPRRLRRRHLRLLSLLDALSDRLDRRPLEPLLARADVRVSAFRLLRDGVLEIPRPRLARALVATLPAGDLSGGGALRRPGRRARVSNAARFRGHVCPAGAQSDRADPGDGAPVGLALGRARRAFALRLARGGLDQAPRPPGVSGSGGLRRRPTGQPRDPPGASAPLDSARAALPGAPGGKPRPRNARGGAHARAPAPREREGLGRVDSPSRRPPLRRADELGDGDPQVRQRSSCRARSRSLSTGTRFGRKASARRASSCARGLSPTSARSEPTPSPSWTTISRSPTSPRRRRRGAGRWRLRTTRFSFFRSSDSVFSWRKSGVRPQACTAPAPRSSRRLSSPSIFR